MRTQEEEEEEEEEISEDEGHVLSNSMLNIRMSRTPIEGSYRLYVSWAAVALAHC